MNLTSFFTPRSIAVVGASDRSESVSNLILRNLRQVDYDGAVIGVHPRNREVVGYPCVESVAELENTAQPIDLGVICVAARLVPDTVEQLADAGTTHAVVCSGGFSETGAGGRALESQLVEVADRRGVTVLGPNSMGFVHFASRAMPSFASFLATNSFQPGPIACVSQSGGMGTSIYLLGVEAGLGFSLLASVGNQTMVDLVDVIDHLATDPETSVVCAYAEQIGRGRALLAAAARLAEADKQLVLMMGGITSAGSRAAVAHTGGIAGNGVVTQSLARQHGIILADSPAEVVAAARLLAGGRRRIPGGKNVAVIVNSGGAGVVATDAIERAGLRLATLSPQTTAALDRILPAFGSSENPVDLTTALTHDVAAITSVISLIDEDPGVDAIVAAGICRSDGVVRYAQSLAAGMSASQHFAMAVWTAGSKLIDDAFADHSLPTFEDAGLGFWALGQVAASIGASTVDEAEQDDGDPGREPELDRGDSVRPTVLTEDVVKRQLATLGTRSTREILARTPQEAAVAAEAIGFPVALKAISPDIPHRARVGGLALGVLNADDVASEFSRIEANTSKQVPGAMLQGVLVQEMVPPGVEILIGISIDPGFGHVLTVGLGGTLAEQLSLVAFALLPLTAVRARRALASLPVINSALSEDQRDALLELMLTVSTWWQQHPSDVVELDLNPVIFNSSGLIITDALAVVRKRAER